MPTKNRGEPLKTIVMSRTEDGISAGQESAEQTNADLLGIWTPLCARIPAFHTAETRRILLFQATAQGASRGLFPRSLIRTGWAKASRGGNPNSCRL